MRLTTFLGIAAGVQLLFLALDLAERHVTRHERYGGEGLRPASLVFLLTVIGGFFALQVAGFALFPPADDLVHRVRDVIAPGVLSAPAPAGWQLLVLAAALFYAIGFIDYAWHRWFSHHRLFWFTHESHHLPSEIFVGMPGLGVRPFAVVTTIPVVIATATLTYATLKLVGGPMWSWTIFQIPLLAASTLLVITHSSFMRRGWLAHRLLAPIGLTSPQEHVLHHTVDLQGNYGNFTTVWDRLFGTYLDPRRPEHQGHRYGLAYDRDYLGSITAGTLQIPAAWRQRFQVARYCNIESPSDATSPAGPGTPVTQRVIS